MTIGRRHALRVRAGDKQERHALVQQLVRHREDQISAEVHVKHGSAERRRPLDQPDRSLQGGNRPNHDSTRLAQLQECLTAHPAAISQPVLSGAVR